MLETKIVENKIVETEFYYVVVSAIRKNKGFILRQAFHDKFDKSRVWFIEDFCVDSGILLMDMFVNYCEKDANFVMRFKPDTKWN